MDEYPSLQVIVKACNYIIGPDQVYEGSWHVEGMFHEHIIASAIYYYSASSSLIDPGLAFRRARDTEEDFPSAMEYSQDTPPPGGMKDWQENVFLGRAPTPQGQLLFFKNTLQHKVGPIRLDEKAGHTIGRRKILCFFLIDPNQRLSLLLTSFSHSLGLFHQEMFLHNNGPFVKEHSSL